MSRLDDAVYGVVRRRRWGGPVVESSPPSPPPDAAPAKVSRSEISYAMATPEVAAAEQAVTNRLIELMAEGLSPLEACKRLFAEGSAP